MFASLVFLAAGLFLVTAAELLARRRPETATDLETKVADLQHQVDTMSSQLSALTEQQGFVHELLASRKEAAPVLPGHGL